MYRIINEFTHLQDGTSTMTFDGTATTVSQTYEYQATQDIVIFKNCSDNAMIVTVGGTPYTVNSGESTTFYNTSSFSVVSPVPLSNQFFTVNSRTDSNILEDGDGNPTQSTYTYNPDGSVQTITEKDASANVLSTTTFTYKANGDVDTSVKVMDGKTVTTQYIYDANGNLTDTVNVRG